VGSPEGCVTLEAADVEYDVRAGLFEVRLQFLGGIWLRKEE
jgi:hypothetical protein